MTDQIGMKTYHHTFEFGGKNVTQGPCTLSREPSVRYMTLKPERQACENAATNIGQGHPVIGLGQAESSLKLAVAV